jgi:putative addiction module killer protein
MRVITTLEFDEWLCALTLKARRQVENRLDRIREHHHFGDSKYLGDQLFELRWMNGRRAYYSKVAIESGELVLMLLGGDKNGQDEDIRRARHIFDRDAP